jgi:S-DNA-T family DNA segregation ATPase FtsK/SpoIIIE
MSRTTSWRLDLTAAGFLLSGLVVALAVFAVDPAAAGRRVYPPATPPHPLGPPGFWVGSLLHETLGGAVYVLLAAWFVLVVLLFLRRGWLFWSLRLVGWLLLLPCTALAADQLGPGWLAGPASGSGGHLGAFLLSWLAANLGPAAQVLVVASCVLIGLLLAAGALVLGCLRCAGLLGLVAVRLLLRVILHRPVPVRRPVPPLVRKKAPQPVPVAVFAPNPESEPETPEAPEPIAEEPEENEEEPVEARTIPIHHHDAASAALQDPVSGVLVSGKPGDSERFADYELPGLELLEDPEKFPYEQRDQHLRERAVLLEKTFADFGLKVRIVGINTGPVITQYEAALETGLRLHKVTALADDLALNLKVPSVRMVAPIPGKSTVGIEVPNEHRARVRLKEVLLASARQAGKAKLPLFLGKDTEGKPLVYDLAEMPHLLIAGRTGTGKSVCLNAIILSMLMTRRPDEVKMIMIDPKMTELIEYAKVPHLMHPIVNKDMKKAEAILSWAVDKMEERYDILSRARVRSIAGYNALSYDEILKRTNPADDEERQHIPERMPYIVIIIDEFGDLMMTMKKEVEGHIIRLAQKSRAAGIHLVLATQKPTVDVITGLIKSNLPARICFQVSSRTDSRVVLDEMGADKLLGKGDMLFLQPGTSTLVRAQGTYLDDVEIQRVVEQLESDPCYAEELIQVSSGVKEGEGSLHERLQARDPVYEQAIEVVVREGRGSVSLLQRALGIGYGRAARLIDFMAEDGIVGGYNGSNAREVLYSPEDWAAFKGEQEALV